ncbi:MAG: hypothetical protein IJ859_12660 [Synergistaceae bacterium]|nr:hypothetical protein [Synergistaceae bacterium]
MSDVIVKKGRDIFVNIEALEEIKNSLFELPEKQRTLLKVKDAVAFLLPSILCAKEKNYSEPEILEHFARFGWFFTPSSARYLWRLVNSMTQGNKRRKNIESYQQADNDNLLNASINSEVITNAIQNMDITKPELQVSDIYEELKKSLPNANKNQEKTHNSAQFEVIPDTEDL